MTPTRRGVMAASLAAIVIGKAQAQERSSKPKTFVLVHGAWHGAWCWRDVRDQLLAQGQKVFTPTLTGLAERSHLMSRDITLDTHITDVASLFEYDAQREPVRTSTSGARYP